MATVGGSNSEAGLLPLIAFNSLLEPSFSHLKPFERRGSMDRRSFLKTLGFLTPVVIFFGKLPRLLWAGKLERGTKNFWEDSEFVQKTVDMSGYGNSVIRARIDGEWQEFKIRNVSKDFIEWNTSKRIEFLERIKSGKMPELGGPHSGAVATYGLGRLDSEFTLNKMKMLQPHTKKTFQRYIKAGVKIAMGTDMALDPEMGANAQELEIYVDYGMTPMEAIQTATKNTAEAIWLGKETGTLEAGKYADIIAINGDPLKDIRILQDKEKIKIVMKEGQIMVDRRPGHQKFVIHDQEGGWQRI